MLGEVKFGPKVKVRRLRLGLTQDEMERRTGLDQAYLSRVERGAIRRPSVHVALLIARALGCSVEELAAHLQPAA